MGRMQKIYPGSSSVTKQTRIRFGYDVSYITYPFVAGIGSGTGKKKYRMQIRMLNIVLNDREKKTNYT